MKNKKILYILTNISMPNICKIGITSNIEKRLKTLSGTNTPSKFQIYETFDIPNAEILEQEILNSFSKNRPHPKREFLEIHPEKIIFYINKNKNKKLEKDISKSKFEKAGIKAGSILNFVYAGNVYTDIKAEVLSSGKIKYQGKITSLSTSAQKILKEKFDTKWKAVQGTIFWSFKGKIVRDLFDLID